MIFLDDRKLPLNEEMREQALGIINEAREELTEFFGQPLLEAVEAHLSGVELLSEEASAGLIAKAYTWLTDAERLIEKRDKDEKTMKYWLVAYVGFLILAMILSFIPVSLSALTGMLIAIGLSLCASLVSLIGLCFKSKDYQDSQSQINAQAKMLMPKLEQMKKNAKNSPELQAKVEQLEELFRKNVKDVQG